MWSLQYCGGKMPLSQKSSPDNMDILRDELRGHVEQIINTPSPRCFGDTTALNKTAQYIEQQFTARWIL